LALLAPLSMSEREGKNSLNVVWWVAVQAGATHSGESCHLLRRVAASWELMVDAWGRIPVDMS